MKVLDGNQRKTKLEELVGRSCWKRLLFTAYTLF